MHSEYMIIKHITHIYQKTYVNITVSIILM